MKNQQFFNQESGLNTFTPYISGIGQVGPEIARLYTAKAKLKGTQLKYMSSKKETIYLF